jgi:hypothetical protein
MGTDHAQHFLCSFSRLTVYFLSIAFVYAFTTAIFFAKTFLLASSELHV